jgi:uncharacterized protein
MRLLANQNGCEIGIVGGTTGLPNYEHAKAYAVARLAHELPPTLLYHSAWHTCDEVAPRAEWLAKREGLSQEAQILIGTAAFYHDIGFVQQTKDHEKASAKIALEILPRFGYTPDQIRLVVGMIMATRIPQAARTHLQQVVADADLDVLGRSDFHARNAALRTEMAALGDVAPDEIWYPNQVAFLKQHRYFTSTARSQRSAGKQENLRIIQEIIAECCPQYQDTPTIAPAPNFAMP